jgi:hypothetical protein
MGTPPDERCPGCGEPITPAACMTTVPYNAAGARAHLGCLESEPGLQDLIPILRADSDPQDRPVVSFVQPEPESCIR